MTGRLNRTQHQLVLEILRDSNLSCEQRDYRILSLYQSTITYRICRGKTKRGLAKSRKRLEEAAGYHSDLLLLELEDQRGHPLSESISNIFAEFPNEIDTILLSTEAVLFQNFFSQLASASPEK